MLDGARFAQQAIQKRGVKISAVQSITLIRPLRAVGAKFLHLYKYRDPIPFLPGQLAPYHGVEVIDGGQVRAAKAPVSEKMAWIQHSPESWEFCRSARIYNGAVPLRVRCAEGEAELVLILRETGPSFRFATLLSAKFVPHTPSCAASVGRLLRGFLRRLKVAVLFASEADAEVATFVKNSARYVHRAPTHWWAIAKDSDAFRHDGVSWWLTSADRDTHFGGLQPWTEA